LSDGPPPRVLQLTATAARRGAEVAAFELGDELRRQGVDVTTVAIRGTTNPTALPIPVLGRSRWDPLGFVRLVRAVLAADVVVGHGSDALLHGALASMLGRRPFVYRSIGDPSHWGRVRGAGLRVGAPLRRARRVVVLYEGAARYLVEHYSIPDDRLVVLANPVRAWQGGAASPEDRAAARRSLRLPAEPPLVGFVGALSPEKRPELAIRAVAALDGVHLVVAGDGERRAECERLATELAAGRMRFLGSVSDVDAVLRGLDVLLLPSATEGGPAVVVEAAAHGVPTVAAAVGGVPELVEGSVGLLLPPSAPVEVIADAVARLIDQGARVDRPDRLRLLERHDLVRVARRWREVLSDARQPTCTR
jgi:glycosyltransferase involved in cell wall biosynthesis